MSDPKQQQMSRREFTALSLAAGVAAAVPPAPVVGMLDRTVEIRTPSGICDAALVHRGDPGRWPAVIMFPDLYGLRPLMREMAMRLATAYTVLVPNPFYRSTKAPGIGPDFDYQSAAGKALMNELRGPLTNEGVMSDTAAYVAFFDTQTAVNPRAKIGVVGYCMGGRMALLAAAGAPDRIGAGASFHGGGLVTDKPDSPHLLVPKVKAEFYFGIAANDDEVQPGAKTELAQAFRAAHREAKIEVYPGTIHGWCIKDSRPREGKPVYDEQQAARAWNEMQALFKRALV